MQDIRRLPIPLLSRALNIPILNVGVCICVLCWAVHEDGLPMAGAIGSSSLPGQKFFILISFSSGEGYKIIRDNKSNLLLPRQLFINFTTQDLLSHSIQTHTHIFIITRKYIINVVRCQRLLKRIINREFISYLITI